MASERAVPFASKPPEGWEDHVEVMRATRMFLLQTMGPTRFVVRGEDSERKFTVLVGSRARCSCGVPLCLHHLFVMLKVLKVPQTNPLAWQTALIDSEVDCILRFGGGGGGGSKDRGGAPPERWAFLRRGSGRTSAGGAVGLEGSLKGVGGGEGTDGGDGTADETRRLEIVPGEVCPVCQEEMEEAGNETGGTGSVAGGKLTYCRNGCGNNMHARCMLMYAEHRRSTGDKACCPLCRIDWGVVAIRALREDTTPPKKGGQLLGRNGRKARGVGGDAAATNNAAVVPVTCRCCRVKIQSAFFRCVACTPAGSWDLCRRCYASAGGASSANGPCTPVGRRAHYFLQAEATANPPEWKPAQRPEGSRSRGGTGVAWRGAPTTDILSLQGREITTADFELLLTLDALPTPPLHEHLLRALPSYGETKQIHEGFGKPLLPIPLSTLQAEVTQSVPAPPRYPLQSLPSQASPHERFGAASAALMAVRDASRGGGRGGGGGPEASVLLSLPLTSPGSTSPPRYGRMTTAGAVLASAAPPPAPSPAPSPSFNVSTAAVVPTVTHPTRALTASAHSEEVAPFSGSFTAKTGTCCWCSYRDGGGDSGTVHNNTNNADGNPAPPAGQNLVSQTLRQLPCGHIAHDACLIPIILEGVGRGDPARCACPVDSSPLFPALVRHRRHRRRRRPGSNHSPTAAAIHHEQFTGTKSAFAAASGTTEASSSAVNRHARAATARESLWGNDGIGGKGSADDTLGIKLVGLGLALSSPSDTGNATATVSAERRIRTRDVVSRTGSAPKSGSAWHDAQGLGDDDRGSGHRGGRKGGGRPRRNGQLREGAFDTPKTNNATLFVGGEMIGGSADAVASIGSVGSAQGVGARRTRRQRSACVIRGSTTGGGGRRHCSSNSAEDSNARSVEELAPTSLSLAVRIGCLKIGEVNRTSLSPGSASGKAVLALAIGDNPSASAGCL